jgi:hypothetical protein
MSSLKGNGVAMTGKALVLGILKIIAILLAFLFKISGLFLTKCGEVCEKISGHESH